MANPQLAPAETMRNILAGVNASVGPEFKFNEDRGVMTSSPTIPFDDVRIYLLSHREALHNTLVNCLRIKLSPDFDGPPVFTKDGIPNGVDTVFKNYNHVYHEMIRQSVGQKMLYDKVTVAALLWSITPDETWGIYFKEKVDKLTGMKNEREEMTLRKQALAIESTYWLYLCDMSTHIDEKYEGRIPQKYTTGALTDKTPLIRNVIAALKRADLSEDHHDIAMIQCLLDINTLNVPAQRRGVLFSLQHGAAGLFESLLSFMGPQRSISASPEERFHESTPAKLASDLYQATTANNIAENQLIKISSLGKCMRNHMTKLPNTYNSSLFINELRNLWETDTMHANVADNVRRVLTKMKESPLALYTGESVVNAILPILDQNRSPYAPQPYINTDGPKLMGQLMEIRRLYQTDVLAGHAEGALYQAVAQLLKTVESDGLLQPNAPTQTRYVSPTNSALSYAVNRLSTSAKASNVVRLQQIAATIQNQPKVGSPNDYLISAIGLLNKLEEQSFLDANTGAEAVSGIDTLDGLKQQMFNFVLPLAKRAKTITHNMTF